MPDKTALLGIGRDRRLLSLSAIRQGYKFPFEGRRREL